MNRQDRTAAGTHLDPSVGWWRRSVMPVMVGMVIAAPQLVGQQPAAPPGPPPGYTKQDSMIAMRDHVRLHIAIYTPTGASGPLPIMLLRTPYGIDGYAEEFGSYLKELAADKYIFVFEDIRGRHESEGQFVMLRPPRDRKDPHAIDESTDAYDTIDWLVKHVPNNNGRVGELGISYDGWTTVMTMLDPHPALKAVSPQASPVRHVHRRRFPPQRRVPSELRLRVRGADGDREGPGDHSPSTATTPTTGTCDLGPLVERRREVPPRQDPVVGRLREPPELR